MRRILSGVLIDGDGASIRQFTLWVKEYKYQPSFIDTCTTHSPDRSQTKLQFYSIKSSKMRFELAVISVAVSMAAGQTLNIPARVGSIVSLPSPSVISGSKDMGNMEYDRGRLCNTDEDIGSDAAVFILENGATLSNVIIGKNQLEGVHCMGACTLKNVWFRDVCEGEWTVY